MKTYTFKKYLNRKYYSLDNSCYVNLDDLLKIIQDDNTFIVTKHDGTDITEQVLWDLFSKLVRLVPSNNQLLEKIVKRVVDHRGYGSYIKFVDEEIRND